MSSWASSRWCVTLRGWGHDGHNPSGPPPPARREPREEASGTHEEKAETAREQFGTGRRQFATACARSRTARVRSPTACDPSETAAWHDRCSGSWAVAGEPRSHGGGRAADARYATRSVPSPEAGEGVGWGLRGCPAGAPQIEGVLARVKA